MGSITAGRHRACHTGPLQRVDAYTLLQAEVGGSRYGLLHTFLDDILEDTWHQNDADWKSHSLAKPSRDSGTRQYEKLLMDASVHPTLSKVTLQNLIREWCWARNTTLTISGYTPAELATGRRPTDHSDLELMKADQLYNISSELQEYIKDTGFIVVVLDSMTSPVMTRAVKNTFKELKNVEEHIFHPGENSNHYCSMMTNMPPSYVNYPLSQTSDRTKIAWQPLQSSSGSPSRLTCQRGMTGLHRATPSFSWILSLRTSVPTRSRT